MTLSEFKNELKKHDTISFQLPNGDLVPRHFHVTEVGKITKDFIDCGGTVRHEEVVNFQLWNANDYDHRLHPNKLISIIEKSENTLGLSDQKIEVEYQGDSIQKYGLAYNGDAFLLTTTHTDCLAKDKCGVEQEPVKNNLVITASKNACDPAGGCC